MISEQDWRNRAACARDLPSGMTPDAWYADSRHDPEAKLAVKICRHCPVWKECRVAGKPERFGIWAGVFKTEGRATKTKIRTGNPTGPRRRLQALATLGWASKDVAGDIRRYTGLRVSPRLLDTIRSGAEMNVPEELGYAIARTYKHLRGQTTGGNSGTASAIAAKTAGWASPRAWVGVDIDDPKAEPGYDEFA